MASFPQRILGALRLDAATYEEVEHDTTALGQAIAVVLVSSVAAAAGSLGAGAEALLIMTVAGLFSWVLWAGIIYLVGVKLLPEAATRSDVGELLRCLGFASAPGVLRVGSVVPFLARPIFLVASLWTLAAMVVAVRQALDYTSTLRAVAVCVLGFAAHMAIFFVVMRVVGVGGFLVGGVGR